MDFFGQLGIDWTLLAAQMVNFGLLLIILSKFLYRPILKRIEKDEKELEQIKIQKEFLEKEKSDFLTKKEQQLIEVKRLSEKILKEAEEIATEIKNTAKEQAEREKTFLLKQARQQIKSKAKAEAKNYAVKFKKEIISNICQNLDLNLTEEEKKIFQQSFFANLLKDIASLPDQFSQTSNLPLVLESALPVNKQQLQGLNDSLDKKLGKKVKVNRKQNKKLISGFRLQIDGILLSQNLFDTVKNAARKTK